MLEYCLAITKISSSKLTVYSTPLFHPVDRVKYPRTCVKVSETSYSCSLSICIVLSESKLKTSRVYMYSYISVLQKDYKSPLFLCNVSIHSPQKACSSTTSSSLIPIILERVLLLHDRMDWGPRPWSSMTDNSDCISIPLCCAKSASKRRTLSFGVMSGEPKTKADFALTGVDGVDVSGMLKALFVERIRGGRLYSVCIA